MKNSRLKGLGVDIGRVLMASVTGGHSDTSFLTGSLEQALNTPPSPYAMASVRDLVHVFEGRVWLVSKAGPNTERKTWAWLLHHGFYEYTGLDQTHVRFCRQRRDKAVHCEMLSISHFIDDRLDVLSHLLGIVPNRYLFGEQDKHVAVPAGVVPVAGWKEAVAKVTQSLR